LGLIFAAIVADGFQLVVFSRLRTSFTPGTKIAGVDVTGLTMEQAASRVTQVYSTPIELRYNDNIIQVKPSNIGFALDLTAMMTAADQARAALPFWPSFIAYLFNQLPPRLKCLCVQILMRNASARILKTRSQHATTWAVALMSLFQAV